mmetsp:Transcript_66476/g.110543  ORF Transcript_66476/g.110543 Transcript_66476/m.110543 type:complete len:330 (-) Transcript_66476:186-1175(-)
MPDSVWILAAAAGSGVIYLASVIRRRNALHFTLPSGCMIGRTAVVTGANSGIGAVVAAELSRAGATTVLACKDVQAAERVASKIKRRTKNNEVHVLGLDLTCLTSLTSFAKKFAEQHGRCDVLVLNAGVMQATYIEADKGVEYTFAANYLGHWALTQLLLPHLQAAHAASGQRARVVAVASRLEKRAPALVCDGSLNLKQLLTKEGYSLGRAYSISKCCQIAGALELQRRYDSFLCSSAVTPGMVNTNLSRFLPAWQRPLAALLKPILLRSPSKGAETVLFASHVEEAKVSGRYLGDCVEVQPSAQAADPQLAKLLWRQSQIWSEDILK